LQAIPTLENEENPSHYKNPKLISPAGCKSFATLAIFCAEGRLPSDVFSYFLKLPARKSLGLDYLAVFSHNDGANGQPTTPERIKSAIVPLFFVFSGQWQNPVTKSQKQTSREPAPGLMLFAAKN
jgi:hypothetical protein